jgi:hypothetical protein
MAVTGAWHSRTGESAGSVGSAITSIVFGGLDDTAGTAAADPITAGNNSIIRFFVIRFTETTTSTATLSNVKIDRSDSAGSGAVLDGAGATEVDAKQGETYGQNVTTNITATSTALQASGANSIALTASDPGGSTSDSQQFAVQVDTGTGATAGVGFTLRCSFDITV